MNDMHPHPSWITALFFFLLCTSINAQTPDELLAQFPKHNIVILKSEEEYVFEYDKSRAGVVVRGKLSDEFICTGVREDFTFAEPYDEETALESMDVYTNGSRNRGLQPKHEYLSIDDIFYSDARLAYLRMEFARKGATNRVVVEKTVRDPKYFVSVFFQEPVPIAAKTVRFVVPRWMKVELRELNFDGHGIQKKKSFDSDRDADVYEYTMKNLDHTEKENGAPGNTYFAPHIQVLCKSAEVGGKRHTFFATLADQYGWYRSLVNSIGNDPAPVREKAFAITQGIADPEAKIKAVFYWVQDNIRYIAFEDGIMGFKPQKAQETMQKKYGDCKAMANLTKEMLRALGFDARLAWLGTNHIAYDYSTPSLGVDNHMICALLYNNRIYYLDATEEYAPFGYCAERIQGRQVIIEDGDKFLLERVPTAKAEDNQHIIRNVFQIAGTALKGNTEHLFKGESRTDLLQQISRVKTDKLTTALLAYLSDNNKYYQVENMTTSDLTNREGDLKIQYATTQQEAVTSFGNELYVGIDFYQEFRDAVIDLAERRHDLMFDFKKNLITETRIDIPAGYTVSSLPEDFEFTRPGFSFSLHFTKAADHILYRKEIKINDIFLKKADFPTWNEAIKGLSKRYLDQVILAK